MRKLMPLVLLCIVSISCFGQDVFENYLLKDVGYISIPKNMELQDGNYKKIAEGYQRQQGKKFGYEISNSRVVFQQKGLNEGEKSAFSSYARIILETIIGNYGDYEKLTTKLLASQKEMAELNEVLKRSVERSFVGTGLKLIDWYGVTIVGINSISALKISYLRQLNDRPKVVVSIYQFHNNDRMHQLTLSYRQEDLDTWKPLYLRVLNSFTITNVR